MCDDTRAERTSRVKRVCGMSSSKRWIVGEVGRKRLVVSDKIYQTRWLAKYWESATDTARAPASLRL